MYTGRRLPSNSPFEICTSFLLKSCSSSQHNMRSTNVHHIAVACDSRLMVTSAPSSCRDTRSGGWMWSNGTEPWLSCFFSCGGGRPGETGRDGVAEGESDLPSGPPSMDGSRECIEGA